MFWLKKILLEVSLHPKIRILVESIRRFLRKGALNRVRNILEKTHHADIATVLKNLSPKERWDIFLLLDKEKAAEVLLELKDSLLVLEILEKLSDDEIVELLSHLPPEDALSLLEGLSENRREKIIPLIEEKKIELSKLLEYGEDTAGRIMSTSFVAFHEDTTVEEAIRKLRESKDKEIFYIYVVDKRGHLLGVVSLRSLLLSNPGDKLKDIMNPYVISVRVDTDQEEVAKIVERYDFLSIPVVDENNRLVGVVTADDVIDIITEEATEDIYRMVGASDEELWEKSLFKIALYRLPWLIFTFIGESISGLILKHYHGTLKHLIAISFFIPLVMALGGNVGNQSQTIVVRALATGRIDEENPWRVLIRQIGAGLIMGFISGAIAAGIVSIIQRNITLALVVGISLLASMTISALVGAVIPVFFKKLNIDPAISSGPFITTFSDIMGTAIYLSLATFLLIKTI